MVVNALNVIDQAIPLVVQSQDLSHDLPYMTISVIDLYVQGHKISTDLEEKKVILDDAIGAELLLAEQNMCCILIHAMEPFMALLLSFVSAQAHVYGLLLSPRYKELRKVDALGCCASFGRVDIVTADVGTTQTGKNTPSTHAHASTLYVHTHANARTHMFLFYTYKEKIACAFLK